MTRTKRDEKSWDDTCGHPELTVVATWLRPDDNLGHRERKLLCARCAGAALVGSDPPWHVEDTLSGHKRLLDARRAAAAADKEILADARLPDGETWGKR